MALRAASLPPDIGPACRPADADPGGRVTVDVPLSRSQAHHDETHQRDYEDEPELQSGDVQIEQRSEDEIGPDRNEEIVAPAPGDAFDQGDSEGQRCGDQDGFDSSSPLP